MKNENKFQEKLRKQILQITFIIVFVALLLFYIAAAFYDEVNSTRKLSVSNVLIGAQFNTLINNCNESFFDMRENADIVQFFDDGKSESAVYQELYIMNQKGNFKYNLVLLNTDQEVIFSSFKAEQLDAVNKSYQSLILRDINITEETVVMSYNAYLQGNSSEYTVVANKISDIGYAMYYLRDADVLGAIERKPADHFIITDRYDRVLVASDNQLISSLNKSVIELDNKDVSINNLVYGKRVSTIYPGITLVSFLYRDSIINNSSLIVIMIMVGGFLAIILNYYSKRISKNTSNSLNQLLEEMDKIKKGNLEELDVRSGDEFEVIADETNEMIREIKQLGIRNEQLADLRRQIEIKQLESQFNPHFLYNTLETIRYTMILDQNIASDLIIKLTKILRYSVAEGSDKVTFKEDLEYIENYLEIMKVRFQERFEYFIKVDKKCYHHIVPKLIVQPLIENSIKHNFKRKEHLNLWMTADIEGNTMLIEIEDNGEGMDEADLLRIKDVFEHATTLNENHIGLSNVSKRLDLLYGDHAKICISSRKGIGTKISISIRIGEE